LANSEAAAGVEMEISGSLFLGPLLLFSLDASQAYRSWGEVEFDSVAVLFYHGSTARAEVEEELYG